MNPTTTTLTLTLTNTADRVAADRLVKKLNAEAKTYLGIRYGAAPAGGSVEVFAECYVPNEEADERRAEFEGLVLMNLAEIALRAV